MTLLEHDTPPPASPPTRRRSLRPLLLRLHFYAGVLVAPFVLVAALSGALYAVSPQLEAWVHHDELTTDSRGPALSIDEQVAAARSAQPDLPLLAVRPAAEPGDTTRVLLDDGRTEQFRRLAVFVDPVDGQVQGELTSYGGSGALPVRTWIDELHRNLLLGEPGRLYSELAASWLGVVALAGLALWWTGRRRTRSRWRPDGTASGRRRTLSWHGVLGTWLVLGMLMLSATGLTWSTYAGAHVSELRAALDWTTPVVVSDTAAGDGTHEGHAGHGGGTSEADSAAPMPDSPGIGFQRAEAVASGQGLSGPLEITRPTSRSGTYVVSELDTSWPTRADVVSVDQAGRVVDVVRFADWPVVAKLASWGIDLHMGVLFGLANQVALLVLALGIAAMTVLGYRMWWQRRPTRGGRRLGRPARRGAWREASPAQLVGVAVVAAAVGWFVPLLGVSLLVFLAVDVALGLRARRARAS
ncbi:PepSY-associated TM helix domain-containing protein [Nocardioides marmoraquaticus]